VCNAGRACPSSAFCFADAVQALGRTDEPVHRSRARRRAQDSPWSRELETPYRPVMHEPHPDDAGRRWHAFLALGAWRRGMRGNPATAAFYRAGVAVVGTLVVLLGIALIPLPGPGWLTVFVGLSILGSEFTWAARLLSWTRRRVGAWTSWITAQPRLVQAGVGASGLVLLVVFALALATSHDLVPITRTAVAAAL
jgi:uncharacterized protein (TIGR02611 family)